MRGPFNFELLPRYAHLSLAEGLIWEKFVKTHPDAFDKVWYDYNIGGIRKNTEKLSPEWEKNRQYLGTYKIDVVGAKDNQLTIIEIKKSATTKALGEIWAYHFLFKGIEGYNKEVMTMILTDEEMPNIREICDEDNTKLIIV